MGPYNMLFRKDIWKPASPGSNFCAADSIPELKRTKLSGLLVLSPMSVMQVIFRYWSQEQWHNEEGKKAQSGQRGKKNDEHQMRVNSSRQ